MTTKYHQKLPGAGAEREELRRKGQFWTPAWVAEAMVAYVVGGGSGHVFDPAVGAGAFFRAAKVIAAETGKRFELLGCEVDRDALRQARESGLTESDLAQIEVTDFVLQPPQRRLDAIVANPPYIRHHRLSPEVKVQLRHLSNSLIGRPLDGRAGLHVYFLLRALQSLAPNGRLAFIMPADTCEGVFAATLWQWVAARYKLDAGITFTPAASPFPGVDTNAVIFFICNTPPADYFLWARCLEANTPELKRWVLSGFEEAGESLDVHRRTVAEGLATGLSRAPLVSASEDSDAPTLGDFARVMRGIATGANEFFFLTRQQAADLRIPDEFLLPAIGRTRDVAGDTIDDDTLTRLDAAGKPTLLFSPDGRAFDEYPEQIQEYLRRGEAAGFHRRSLIATRRP
ncbi:MAG: N-6 DNA methylase, partial [Pyrinomonadaceae bacterium]